jgi:hypothetical protein
MTAPTTLYGVTPAGFVAQPIQSILADLQAAWTGTVDTTADLSPTTPEGQWLGILANRYAAIWALAEASWNAYNRQGSTTSATSSACPGRDRASRR